MKSIALSGNKREERGTAMSNLLRKEEKIPCVIYGGKENVHFTVNEIKFSKIINTPEVYFIDLDVDGAKFKAIIKEVQFHPVTDRVIHIDFLEVSDDKAVTVSIPVTFLGQSKGVLNGGTLRKVTRKLKINGLPSALPETVEIDISPLKIGMSIKVADISVAGLTFLDAPNAVVVAVKMSRVAVAEDEEEGAEGEGAAEGNEEGGEGGEGGEAKTEAAPAE